MAKGQPAKRGRRRGGFTLIEMLIVVTIIGILASVAAPGYSSAMDRARCAASANNGKNVQIAIEDFASENAGAVPCSFRCLRTTRGGRRRKSQTRDAETFMKPGGTEKHPDDGLDGYLTDGVLPLSLWSQTTPQRSMGDIADDLQGTETPLATAAELADGKRQGDVGSTLDSHGATPLTNYDVSHEFYGVILYSGDPASQSYVVYSTGKHHAKNIVVGMSTNAGH